MLQEITESLVGYFRDNWPEILWIVAAASIASYVAGSRSRNRWKKRNFLNRLNVTLTRIENKQLKIRTILEMDCEQIFLNASAANEIVRLAKQTTDDDPLIPIPPDDCWQYLNAVLNEISERFAEGQIRQDLGQPVHKGQYVLCLTCERAGPVRTQKIRAMLLQKEFLMNLPAEEPEYEAKSHSTRWLTLQQLADVYPDRPYAFLDLEICV